MANQQNPDFPIPFPLQIALPQSNSVTLERLLVNNYALRDTSAHDYTTDGGTYASPGPFFLAVLGDVAKGGRSIVNFAIAIKNTTDQDVTITPIENVVPDQSWDNMEVDTSATVVSAGTNNKLSFPWSDYALEFLGVKLQVVGATAPTKGYVQVVLLVYFG